MNMFTTQQVSSHSQQPVAHCVSSGKAERWDCEYTSCSTLDTHNKPPEYTNICRKWRTQPPERKPAFLALSPGCTAMNGGCRSNTRSNTHTYTFTGRLHTPTPLQKGYIAPNPSTVTKSLYGYTQESCTIVTVKGSMIAGASCAYILSLWIQSK